MQTDLEILQIIGENPNGVTTNRISKTLRLTPQELGYVFERLLTDKKILGFAGLWVSPGALTEGTKRFVDALQQLHDADPENQGIEPASVVKAAELKWEGKPLDRIITKLTSEGVIEKHGNGICLPSFQLQLTPRQRSLLDRVVEILEQEPVNTPNAHGIAQLLGIPIQAIEEILRLALRRHEVVQVSDVVFYTPKQLDNLKQFVATYAENGPFAATDLRDALKSTRKYVQPLLDYFDSIGFTEKHGTTRSLTPSAERQAPFPG